ncbi:MAG: AraC family transcriptional regulator [Lewinellaceae bacterium]|nr:AraC family transcriptional regulator [Lewinellaceae bacterium]
MATMIQLKKKEGFEGQKAIVIPRRILANQCEKNSIISTLYVTDIGYYPRAKYHFRERPTGADQHILIYCQTGSGAAEINGEKLHIRPGDFLIIPRDAPHWYAADSDHPWTIYWVHFKGSISEAIVSLINKQFGGAKGYLRHAGSSIALFEEIYNQLEKGYGSDNLVYSNMCLSHFLTTLIYNEKFGTPDQPPQHDNVDQAIEFFRANLDRMLTLEEIASSVNLSTSHFSFLFKKKTGFPPIEYFNHLKMQKACQYLLFTELRIKEIAICLGMDDAYYFSRIFSKVMGVSPKAYREMKGHQS